MPHPLGKIRILMSARVLLDLEKADQVFKEKGLGEYIDYMRCRGKYKKDYDPKIGGRRLEKGPLWNFAVAALKLNEASDEPIVEIGLSCKDQSDTALPIFRSIDVNGLGNVNFRLATAGNMIEKEDHEGFGTDLFLTRNHEDTQKAVNQGIAAATINFPPDGESYHCNGQSVRIWVDGDAVAFGGSSEVRYSTRDLERYRALESKDFMKKIEPGPMTDMLAKISKLNEQFPRDKQPFELSLLTARGGPAAARVFAIAEHHGIHFNGRMIFLGLMPKEDILKSHKPDLFVDDKMKNLKESMKYCPTGLVAYPEGSPMYRCMARKAKAGKVESSVLENGKDITKKPQSGIKKPISKKNIPGKKL